MSQQIITRDPSSSQNAPQPGNPLETLLQVLSHVPSEMVLLQEAAMAEEATIDALITKFEDMTSLLKQAKRQRKLKRKDCTNVSREPQSWINLDSKTLGNRARMPIEVLRQLTQSGFLSTADLAKTLLLTCKGYGTDLGREYVYEYLCKSRWRNLTKLPPSLIANRGYHWLFRNLSRAICVSAPENELPPIPPPALDHNDMLFFISIRDESGTEIVSEVLGGEQLDTLKLDGVASISLEQPITIGTYPSTTASNCLCSAEAYHHNWSVTVHLFRLDESKFCGVLHASDSYVLMRFEYPNENAVDRRLWTAALRFEGSVDTALPVPTLELDEGDKMLAGRIQRYCNNAYKFQGIIFDVRLNCSVRAQEQLQDEPSAHTVVLECGQVRLAALRVESRGIGLKSNKAEFVHACTQYHGVTLLHLLEHLKGWHLDD
jgi:hypothetical protein